MFAGEQCGWRLVGGYNGMWAVYRKPSEREREREREEIKKKFLNYARMIKLMFCGWISPSYILNISKFGGDCVN